MFACTSVHRPNRHKQTACAWLDVDSAAGKMWCNVLIVLVRWVTWVLKSGWVWCVLDSSHGQAVKCEITPRMRMRWEACSFRMCCCGSPHASAFFCNRSNCSAESCGYWRSSSSVCCRISCLLSGILRAPIHRWMPASECAPV